MIHILLDCHHPVFSERKGDALKIRYLSFLKPRPTIRTPKSLRRYSLIFLNPMV